MSSLMKRVINKIEDEILLKIFSKKVNYTIYTYRYKYSIKNKILLFFPLSEYMHLGDHLFFEPLANSLRSRGFDVSIYPSKIMEFYFKGLNYKIHSGDSLAGYDVIFSRSVFFRFLINQKNVIFYDYINTSLREPICLDIIKKVFYILGQPVYNIISEPNILEVSCSTIHLNHSNKYILFNNYLDSGNSLNSNKSLKKIEKKALELKSMGYTLIQLGTEEERKNDHKEYPYIDLDLRGQTSVADLFYLSSRSNVVGNVGFDAFLMHLFFINRKMNYIYLRNKITKARSLTTLKYLNPPFEAMNYDKIEYLNDSLPRFC